MSNECHYCWTEHYETKCDENNLHAHIEGLSDKVEDAQSELSRLRAENSRLNEIVNSPEKFDLHEHNKLVKHFHKVCEERDAIKSQLAQVTTLHKATNERLQMCIEALERACFCHELHPDIGGQCEPCNSLKQIRNIKG